MGRSRNSFLIVALGIVLASPMACKKTESGAASGGVTCTDISGTPWTPSITGAGAGNHDATVVVSNEVYTGSGNVTGVGNAYTGREITVTFPMTEDLGAYGSITLNAEPTTFPLSSGSAYPMLVSLHDGTNEWVNLDPTCASQGMYDCTSGSCVARASCAPVSPSSFVDREHYLQNQIAIFGYTSVNTFPRCNWAGGSAGSATSPSCGSVGFLSGGKLRSGVGVTYTAKYILLTSHYSSVPSSGYTGGLKVTVTKKKDTTSGGAVDVNVILVGNKNINDSRTAKGQQNLNLLFEKVHAHLNQAGTGVKLGTVTPIEWSCQEGGDSYATADIDALDTMFSAGNSKIPSSTSGKAINLYLVSTITSSSTAGLTILGVSGGIGGPTINGTGSSGLVFSSFNKMATFNPSCSLGSCPITSQEKSFVDMGSTIAHEAGHYLGLNHLSESSGSTHDPVLDTPVCTTKSGNPNYITTTSCRTLDSSTHPVTGNTCSSQCGTYSTVSGTYCPAAVECQFNHLMWWLAKNFTPSTGTGDGNIISSNSSVQLNYNAFVQ